MSDLDAAIDLAKMLEAQGIEVCSRYGEGSAALEQLKGATMSEDTAHGQHFEPTNGAAQAVPQQLNPQEVLDQQVQRVAQLSNRVETLLATAQEAFQEFAMESAIMFQTLEAFARSIDKEQHANRPTNGTTEQAQA